MELVENRADVERRFGKWHGSEDLEDYPFVENRYAPFTPARRALPMLNLALISSAGAYIDGTRPFDSENWDGDTGYREIPVEIEAEDLLYTARGFDPTAVEKDMNSQIPIERLQEYEQNSVIGRLNHVWWSVSGYIQNSSLVVDELAPKLCDRLKRYEIQAALLIPASRLCHQTLGIVARAVELANIPTIMLSIDRDITDSLRPPRTAYHVGRAGAVSGEPGWPEHQRRILDETLRWIETFDQPGTRKLAVKLETETEMARGER
ncbi:MAG: glycine/sarcosine/betaine reductase selenoprotein B family protein [Acidobacteriota bacterium]|nr:glycine/sarcosine/betaine reductase selenoprotein B family protein [Acidobacteriota bacterium]MDH3530049.1 glycine/sarcosine/betaine reductase selenoprotein B family protein [Acidobacteriota bacterium]